LTVSSWQHWPKDCVRVCRARCYHWRPPSESWRDL